MLLGEFNGALAAGTYSTPSIELQERRTANAAMLIAVSAPPHADRTVSLELVRMPLDLRPRANSPCQGTRPGMKVYARIMQEKAVTRRKEVKLETL